MVDRLGDHHRVPVGVARSSACCGHVQDYRSLSNKFRVLRIDLIDPLHRRK